DQIPPNHDQRSHEHAIQTVQHAGPQAQDHFLATLLIDQTEQLLGHGEDVLFFQPLSLYANTKDVLFLLKRDVLINAFHGPVLSRGGAGSWSAALHLTSLVPTLL